MARSRLVSRDFDTSHVWYAVSRRVAPCECLIYRTHERQTNDNQDCQEPHQNHHPSIQLVMMEPGALSFPVDASAEPLHIRYVWLAHSSPWDGPILAPEFLQRETTMIAEPTRIEDLFPTAGPLFNGRRHRRTSITIMTLLIAAGVLVLLGARLLHWADRNL
jgi:hypothetical protein